MYFVARVCSSRPHYIEYLSALVTHHSIDPLTILSADDLESLVRRANRRMPPRPQGLVDGIYRDYLAQVSYGGHGPHPLRVRFFFRLPLPERIMLSI